MAGDSKLLGTLVLDSSGVLRTIKEVNDALKTLGKGVDLDLTNNLKASVQKMMEPLRKQMEEVAKASTGHTARQVSEQEKVTKLLKEQYDAQIKFAKANDEGSLQQQLTRYEKISKALEGYTKELRDEAELLPVIQRKREALEEAETKAASRAAEAKQKAFDKEFAAQEKAEQQQQARVREYNVNSLNEQMKARQDYVNWWIGALDKQEAEQEAANKEWEKSTLAAIEFNTKALDTYQAAQKKAFDSQVQEAVKLKQEIQRINAQLNNSSTGAATRDALQAQLQAKVAAYNQYSREVRNAAEQDREVLKLQEQITLESAKQADALAEAARKEAERKAQQQNDRIGNQIATKIGQFSLNLIKNQWSAAVDYAQTYYNKLNEIRTITGKTEEQATRMGDNLRRLAKEMNVTSTELAEAAVTFYRQGLGDEQVEARLEWVTKYAKLAKIEFSSAAELVTAAMNSMAKDIDEDVQRVVDVFLYLGDAAATSGEEIGKAMQKASASATEFGLSFEWLGAYIATVAETTRQAPESIGNAFNSMLARMHNIKQRGFNEEDATKINDVAKALATVDIALLDSENNWRNMSDIFKDVSEKWADMDGKQKSYIATTLAGTRQQNVFFALMNDMSKGLENGSRAWELYEGAMESAGTAADKYSIWQESAEAAQERLKNSLEGLYASMKPGIIKDFYNSISWLVDGISELDGMAIVVGAFAGAIVLFASSVAKAGRILEATKTAFMNHPIFMAATVAVGVVAAVGAVAAAIESAAERYEDATKRIEESNDKIDSLSKAENGVNTLLEKVGNDAKITTEELKKYLGNLDDIREISPKARDAIDQLTTGVGNQSEALKTLNEELERAIENNKAQLEIDSRNALSGYTNSDFYNANKGYTSREDFNRARASLPSEYGILRVASDSNGTLYDELMNAMEAYNKTVDDVDFLEEQVELYFSAYEKQLASSLENEANIVVQHVLNSFATKNLSLYQKETVSKAILDAIMGDDGTLDISDLAESRIRSIYSSLINAASEAIKDEGAYLDELYSLIYEKYDLNLDDFSWAFKTLETDSMGNPIYEIEEISGAATDKIYELLEAGASISQIQEAFKDTENTTQFLENLDKIVIITKEASESTKELGQDADSSFSESSKAADKWAKSIDSTFSTVDKIDKMIEGLQKDGNVSISDILGLAESHPDILTAAKDVDTLIAKLEEIKKLEEDSAKAGLADAIKRDKDLYESSAWKNQGDQFSRTYGVDINSFEDLENFLNSSTFIDSAGKSQSEHFVKALNDKVNEYVNALLGITQKTEEMKKEEDKLIKTVASSLSEVDKIDTMIAKQEKGEDISVSDILHLAETHEDILTSIGDVESLKKKLKELKALEESNARDALRQQILSSKDVFANGEKNGLPKEWLEKNNVETWQDYYNLFNGNVPKGVSDYVESLIDDLMKYTKTSKEATETTEELKIGWQQLADEAKRAGVEIGDSESLESFLYDRFRYMSHDDIGTYMKKQLQLGNVDLLNRPKYIDEEGNYETVFSTGYTVGQNDKTYNLVVTPILPDGTKLDNEALDAYIDQLQLSGDILEADKVENGGLGLVLWMQELGDNIEDDNQKAELFAETLHVLQDLYYADTSIEGFAKKAADEIEMARAAAENFQVQLMELLSILQGGGDYNDFYSKWMGIDPNIQEAMLKQFPQLAIAINDAKKATEQFGAGSQEADSKLKVLNRTIENITKNNAAQYFDKTVKAIDSVYKGSTRIVDGYAAMNKEIETAIKAQIEYEAASKELAAGNEINANSISNIASLLGGLDTQWIIDNWAQIGPLMSNALQEGEEAIQRFNEAALITIMGTADVNFSDLENGLITVNEEAEAALQTLQATGQFTLEEIPLDQEAWIFENGAWIKKFLPGIQRVLKPTNNNPLSTARSSYKPKTSTSTRTNTPRSSGGRSGGGGGGSGNSSSSSNEMTEVERMLDVMEQVQKIYNNTQNMFQAEQNYYKQTGELQGVILYLQKEGELLVGQNKVIEENVKEIETWIAQKKQELSTLSNSSEEYKTAADDLKALEERHQQYSKELIDNKTQLDKLNKSIKEQNDTIRKMEIDLRNTILEAIKDREALNERMLEGTITTENTILGLIQKRYEKERDMILDNAQKQIDALKEERDLLSEQLQLRKEQEEMEDKTAKLADLESKYARITADPTRRNEALSIQKQIEELRREMSWDTAERELKSQQENLDKQISSIEDYVEYVQNWYDELFKHPQRLIEEMQSIIVQVDDDIIAWLKEADESFAEATEATQTKMVNDWSQMLMDMHGEIKTYWDEVEEIIAGGDEAIIKFLVENSAAYREAGKLQAQAYVDQWKKQLSDLAAAHRKVTENLVLNTYSVFNAMERALSGGRSSSSSGGSYGGGSISTANTVTQSSSTNGLPANKNTSKKTADPKYFTMSYMGKTGTGTSKGAAYDDLISRAGAAAEQLGYEYFASRAIPHYKNGGKVDFTGLAWMDGTKAHHEDVLNPHQSELFESLVRSFETISKVKTPVLPMIGNDWVNGRGNAVNVGDIILNVDKLESDDDYSEIAEKVLEAIMEKVGRGSAIGGIRF